MTALGSLPEKIPLSDPAQLRAAATKLGGLSNDIGDAGRSVTTTTGGFAAGSPDWSGRANRAWRALGTAQAEDCRRCDTAVEQMASALVWLATRLEDAQSDLDAARGDLERIDFEILLAAGKDLLTPGRSRAADLTQDRDRALAAGQRALDDAERDSRVAAGRFDDIAAGAARIDDRVGPVPGAPNGSGPAPTKAALLLTMLLGSVAHNRMKGAGFERVMLKELGLTKNTQKLLGTSLKGSQRNVIPDANTARELVEIKSSRYQSNSAQLQRMASLATAARPLVLVVAPNTRLSRPLKEIIAREGSNVVLRRRLPGRAPGVFSDNVNPKKPNTLYRRDPATKTFNELPPQHQTIRGRPGGPGVRGVPPPPTPRSPSPHSAPRPTGPRVRIPFGK